MSLDPLNGECFGIFGYGNGHLAPESRAGQWEGAGYCKVCRLSMECWQALKDEANKDPAVPEYYSQLQIDAQRRGISTGQLAAERMLTGESDPYITKMMDNTQRGLDERFRDNPPNVHR